MTINGTAVAFPGFVTIVRTGYTDLNGNTLGLLIVRKLPACIVSALLSTNILACIYIVFSTFDTGWGRPALLFEMTVAAPLL